MDAALATRIKTATLVLVPVLGALYFGGIPLRILVLLVFAAINWELLGMSSQLTSSQRNVTWLLLFFLPLGCFMGGVRAWALAFIAAALAAFVLEVIQAERERHEQSRLEPIALLGLAFIYTGVLGSALFTAADIASRERLFWLLATVIAADTCAYFTGRSFKGPKLSPRISPNKTVSGAIGGLLGAALVSLAVSRGFGFAEHPAIGFFWGLLIGVLAIFGDLFESLVKRTFGRKDSGNLLPGHGGVLDRVDALLFAAPVLFFAGRL